MLPLDNTPWPPPRLTPVWRDMQIWKAWYGGQPRDLQAVYGNISTSGNSTVARQFFDLDKPGTSQNNAVARHFWGEPIPPGERRTKMHIPLAADISQLSAGLLFSELPQVRANGDPVTSARVKSFLDDRGHAALLKGADIDSGMGGVYLRIVWDKALRDKPWITVFEPDAAIPEWSFDCLAAVTFWSTLQDHDGADGVEWRLLERHTPGLIEYGLYKGDINDIGERVPLASHPEGEAIIPALTDPVAEVQATGITRLLACHVPNLLPNKLWSHVPGAAPLGRSDYAGGTEGMFDALDEAWTSWMWDLRAARSRLIVPQSMLEPQGQGQTAIFRDRSVFVPLNILSDDADAITMNQFKIRVMEHQQTTESLVNQAMSSAGYSSQSLGSGKGRVAVTATEVAARKEQSLATRDAKILYWRPEIIDLLGTMLEVDRVYFNTPGIDPAAELTLTFPDAVQPDPLQQAQALSLLRSAKAMSTQTMVQIQHADWGPDAVAAEVARINGEDAAPPSVNLNGVLPVDPAAEDAPAGGNGDPVEAQPAAQVAA